MEWEFHPLAENELIESATYYESEVPGLGRLFGNAVSNAMSLIAENPEIGSPIDSELRSFVIGSFPYSIIYGPYKGLLFVLALAHSSRKPGYWKSRQFR